MKSTLTASGLREMAKAICAAYARRDEIRNRIAQYDADCERRIVKLRAELETLERRCDPEDLAALTEITVRREQVARVQSKFASDRVALVEQVDREAAAAVKGCNIPGLMEAAHKATLDELTSMLVPFAETSERAAAFAAKVDAVTALAGLANLTQHPNLGPTTFLPRLKQYAAGGRLWGQI
jgi:hypothetical protein